MSFVAQMSSVLIYRKRNNSWESDILFPFCVGGCLRIEWLVKLSYRHTSKFRQMFCF